MGDRYMLVKAEKFIDKDLLSKFVAKAVFAPQHSTLRQARWKHQTGL
jgi:hypothetical protein